MTTSPNMSLSLPSVGTEPSPDWGLELNNSLSTIDQHNHAAGNGVQITPAGLNINVDLPFGVNNATQMRSVRFSPQGSPIAGVLDLACISVSGVDLYYRDGNGNQVRITQGGNVAGSAGSITGLVPPASVTYVSGTQTFVFQSDAVTPANLDGGALTLRNISASSNGITLSPPPALAANYSLTLPGALPGAQNFMSLDAAGNIAAVWNVDNTTIEIVSNNLRVKPGGISGTQIANGSIAGIKLTNNVQLTGSLTAATVLEATTGMYPGGDLLAGFIARTSNTIDIQGSTVIDTHPIVVSANPSSAGLLIVRGNVDPSGAIQTGEGFSVAHPSAGIFNITFSTPYLDVPAVVPTTNTVQARFISIAAPTTTGVQIRINDNTSAPVDDFFSFIAIGQRA